ncbi:YqhR family membrane protein [Paenibacillus sp. FSL H8-0034]|uniref:YqhR family membrane protein n=1 Tax=Paenibacillus sp. FSL H8-0034 TaxID=2954671 RepID=UPI0030F4D676
MEKEQAAARSSNKWFFSLYIGFYAGLIWGAVKMAESLFHFSNLSPGFMVEPFFKSSFLVTWQGYLLGWCVFIVFSIAASMLYALIFAKSAGPWAGLGYGAIWWGLIFLLIGPITGMMNWIAYLDLKTILTELCLFILWGLFIGYSIAFEFNDEREREPFKNGGSNPQAE